MKTMLSSNRRLYVARAGIFLLAIALIAGMTGCPDIDPPLDLEIRTWNDLHAIRDNLGGNHRLMNNLDSTTAGYEALASATANEGQGWQPIGTLIRPFTGTFDGQGFEIIDLVIDRPGEVLVGLFSDVAEAGVIENVGMGNATVRGYTVTGGLVADNNGTVSNSYFSGSVIGHEHVGGLVGYNFGTVSNSYSSGNVTADKYVGGLVGYNEGIINNSYSIGSATGGEPVGGLVAVNEGTVSDSFWDIQTSGQATSAGGTGKTTAEMMDIATFTGAGWNITAVANPGDRNHSYIWNIVDDVIYPFLSWEPVV